jgi:putative ABC transport system permease protein
MTSMLRRLWYRMTQARRDADLAEEMETHRQLRQAQLEREGLSVAAATLASRRAFGNVTLAREDAHDVWTWAWFEHAMQDLRIALRGLRQSPTFTIVAVGTLALGIGANTALFSIFNSLLLRQLAVRDPAGLVLLDQGSWTYPIFEAVQAQAGPAFDGVFAVANREFDLASGGQRAPIDGAFASGRMFNVLGVTAARGRLLSPSDDRREGEPTVAVISHRFWQQRYAGADSAVGSTITLDRHAFTIVGVMPAAFTGPDVGRVADVVVPFAAEPVLLGAESALPRRTTWWLDIMARLKPGTSLAQANAALQAVQPGIREAARPEREAEFMEEPLTLVPAATGRSPLRRRFETPLRAMLATVGLVLLIACANLANLMLARALARRRELSVRLALGASRWRVARLLAFETVAIVAAGAAIGIVFAMWSSTLLVRQLATWRGAITLDLSLDWRVLAFTTALACLTAIIAGILPAFAVTGVAPGDAMKESGRTIAGDRRLSIRGALVVSQIALSLVLVIGAGLFLRTFTSLSQTPLGFAPGGLTVANVNLAATATDETGRPELVTRIESAVAAAPGVRATGLSVITPITGSGWNDRIGAATEGRPSPATMAWLNAVTPAWFETMGIRLRSGRGFAATDRIGGPKVAIVNETFARRFLAGRPPVGQRVTAGGPRDRSDYEVVGVVADAVYRSLREGMVPTMYLPLTQQERLQGSITLTVATTTAARGSANRIVADALRGVDPALTFTIRDFDQFLRGGLMQERLVALLSTFFGGLALLLAAVGLYGVVTHAVNVRRTEIGVRMALGASRAGILWLVFRRVSVMVCLGLAAGLALSLWTSRFVGALLFRLEPRDATTFAGAVAVLVAASVLAAWIPARRAARLDPAYVLRSE